MRAIPLVVAFLAGCASAPAQVEEPEQPVGSTERMLFCIESQVQVMCVSEDGGRVLKYFMPIPQWEPQT